jgi:hypothetical protein
MASQARFLDFLDMIDGGGAGQMGDTFEGGGIFSALANLMATPYGSEDAGRKTSREAFLRGRGLLDEPAVASAATSAAAPAMTGPTRAQRMSAAAAEMARQRGLAQDSLDPRGPNQMGMPAGGMPPAPSYAMMDMGEAGRGSMPNPFTGPTYDMPMARPAAPAEPLGVTTQSMARDAITQRKKNLYETMRGSLDPFNSTADRDYRRLSGESMGLFNYGNHVDAGLMDENRLNFITQGLMPPTPETMQYSGRGMASGDAEFDAFMNMVRNTPGQGGLANNPELAFSVFQRMKSAGNLPSVLGYQ